MVKEILLTSFTTWLPEQNSNSSDDLLQEIIKSDYEFISLQLLRLLPVDIELASCRVINQIQALRPAAIICCGMAERRSKLTVEALARCGESLLKSTVDLSQLITDSSTIEISQDAGNFVCEGLYYSVLNYISENQLNLPCLFVHVPRLHQANLAMMVADFQLILHRLRKL